MWSLTIASTSQHFCFALSQRDQPLCGKMEVVICWAELVKGMKGGLCSVFLNPPTSPLVFNFTFTSTFTVLKFSKTFGSCKLLTGLSFLRPVWQTHSHPSCCDSNVISVVLLSKISTPLQPPIPKSVYKDRYFSYSLIRESFSFRRTGIVFQFAHGCVSRAWHTAHSVNNSNAWANGCMDK